MARTKLGKQAQAVTRQQLEDDLHEVCELAKKASGRQYDEAHDWLDDLLSAWEFACQMQR